MPKITANLDFTSIASAGSSDSPASQASVQNFALMVNKVYQSLSKTVNGNIGMGNGTSSDNINGAYVNTTTPGTPSTNFTVNHNLGRIPTGWHLVQKNGACDIWLGSTPATTTQITLQASAASVAIRLFIF